MPIRWKLIFSTFAFMMLGAVVGGAVVFNAVTQPPRPIYFTEDCSPPQAI